MAVDPHSATKAEFSDVKDVSDEFVHNGDFSNWLEVQYNGELFELLHRSMFSLTYRFSC